MVQLVVPVYRPTCVRPLGLAPRDVGPPVRSSLVENRGPLVDGAAGRGSRAPSVGGPDAVLRIVPLGLVRVSRPWDEGRIVRSDVETLR